MKKKLRLVLLRIFDTPETIARHEHYMRCWNEYRERDRNGEYRFGNVHLDYEQTLKESGPPGDYRICEYGYE